MLRMAAEPQNHYQRARDCAFHLPHGDAHWVAWIADFLAVNDGASGVSELSGFTGGSVDGGCAHEEADLLRRLFAFALTIQINSGNFAAGFAEWNRDGRSCLARPAQLCLVFFSVKLRFRNNLQLFADRIRVSVVPFDSLHACLPARIDPGPNRGRSTTSGGKIHIFAGRLS